MWWPLPRAESSRGGREGAWSGEHRGGLFVPSHSLHVQEAWGSWPNLGRMRAAATFSPPLYFITTGPGLHCTLAEGRPTFQLGCKHLYINTFSLPYRVAKVKTNQAALYFLGDLICQEE